jgi:hypothetical protein
VPTWALIAALVAAAFAACADKSGREERAPGTGLHVQKAWSVAREVSGHRVHVVKAKLACSSCHTMTGSAMAPVTPDACATCHARQARIEHAPASAERTFGAGIKSDCRLCHAFTLDATRHDSPALQADPHGSAGAAGAPAEFFAGLQPFSPRDCKRCHQVAQGATAAVTVHATQPCESCHQPHEDSSPQSAPCAACHAEITSAHAARGQTPTQACRACHQHQHAEAVEARRTCVDCHSSRPSLVPTTALFAGGHPECVTCHEPHAFEAGRAAACTDCHRVNVLGSRADGKHGAHERCTSCHGAHDVRASAPAACAGCHQDVHSDHPKFGAAGACVGCHDPHPGSKSPESASRACGSCHELGAVDHRDQAPHGDVSCSGCHRPHRFQLALGERTLCTGCHALRVEQTGANRGHTDCTSCHAGLPHAPQEKAADCRGCHAAEHDAARTGHSRCAECHEPHSGAQSAPCRSCHASEHATAPRGHQTCTNCHEPHGGSADKPCSECHATQASSPHGRAQQACTSCHRAHGPEGKVLAPCASCHSQASLSGLHREPEHRRCAGCHTGHGDSLPAGREPCTGCHRDRLQHFPNGACTSCHLFGSRQP